MFNGIKTVEKPEGGQKYELHWGGEVAPFDTYEEATRELTKKMAESAGRPSTQNVIETSDGGS